MAAYYVQICSLSKTFLILALPHPDVNVHDKIHSHNKMYSVISQQKKEWIKVMMQHDNMGNDLIVTRKTSYHDGSNCIDQGMLKRVIKIIIVFVFLMK